jgi:Uma2 family endonuclease
MPAAVPSDAMVDLATPAPGVRLRGLRADEYEELIRLGVFEGEPVELLGGELLHMSPQGRLHEWPIVELNRQLAPLMAAGYDVRVQLLLRVDDRSLPEPDVAVTDRVVRGGRPSTAHLVVEVAVTSQRLDLVHKAPRYAAAGIPMYLVVDVPAERAVLHTDPTAEGYATTVVLGPDDQLAVLGLDLDLRALLTG